MSREWYKKHGRFYARVRVAIDRSAKGGSIQIGRDYLEDIFEREKIQACQSNYDESINGVIEDSKQKALRLFATWMRMFCTEGYHA